MDYSTWTANLKSRGYNTTSLGGNEANFADYGNALSNDVKAKVAKNAQTDADKQLQAYVASLFGGKSCMQASDLMKLAKSKGLKVSTSYVKTSYIVDEKAGGQRKGAKRVIQGSVAIYEITDSKGGKLTIADANGNAAIEMEEVFLNEVLSGVTSDISAGAAGGGAGAEADNSAQIEALKAKNEEFKKQLDELQKQYDKEVEDAENNVKEEQAAIERETQAIVRAWEQKVEADPSKIYDMNAELQGVLATRNANIARYENEINSNPSMAAMQNLINNALKTETELSAIDGYKAQQMPGKMSSAEKYNEQMKENAKAAAGLTVTATAASLSNSAKASSAQNEGRDNNADAKRSYERKLATEEAEKAQKAEETEKAEEAKKQKKQEAAA